MQRSLVYGDQVISIPPPASCSCFLLPLLLLLPAPASSYLFSSSCFLLHLLLLPQVTKLLSASAVWKDYEQQKHDLFLDTEKPLALTQVNNFYSSISYSSSLQSSTVGYLTMNKTSLPNAPPPIDDSLDDSGGLLG